MDGIISGFFPKIYEVSSYIETEKGYTFELQSMSESGVCPSCAEESRHVHSYQEKKPRDLPILGKTVLLKVQQKKYYCDNEKCGVELFIERTGFIDHYSQFTTRCREYMLKVAVHVSCEAAVKILSYQGIRVSGDTLLNMLKAAGADYKSSVGNKIGVDDWAYRKGQTYGTLICDLETHEVIEVLEGRDSETLENWLKGHPHIEIVSRDRATAYSSAVRNTLPAAIQIADRFHITQNLLNALKETMKSFMPQIVEIPVEETVEQEEVEVIVQQRVKKTANASNVKPRKKADATKSKTSTT
jgi:transposase